MKITICFGGSVFNPENIDHEIIEEIAEELTLLKKRNHDIFVVTGGGKTAKSYIEVGKKLGASDKDLDHMGILATRLNARLLIAALGEDALEEPPQNFEKAVQSSLRNKIPIMGGTSPGHTTDAVAAELAENSDSELLIYFTDVGGVYTTDPNKNQNAEKITKMTTDDLSEIMSKMEFEPGMTAVIDPFAAEIIKQNRIKTLVSGRRDIDRLLKIVEKNVHTGTEIVPSERE